MKKWFLFSVWCVVLVVVWGGCAPAQAQTRDLKPTFISPTPGLYVNGWPAFTISYPKDWITEPVVMGEDFKVGKQRGMRFLSPMLTIVTSPSAAPLGDLSAKAFIARQPRYIKDFKVLYDKPSQLSDGTPAQEAELTYVLGPGAGDLHVFVLSAKKEMTHVLISVVAEEGWGGEVVNPAEMKRIAYTLQFVPGKDQPAEVPPDVRVFLDQWCGDMQRGELAKIMSSYSDKYNYKGLNKKLMEQWMRDDPGSQLKMSLGSAAASVTVFQAQGEKAYVAGFISGKTKDGNTLADSPINGIQIIKEDGQWKWYGDKK